MWLTLSYTYASINVHYSEAPLKYGFTLRRHSRMMSKRIKREGSASAARSAFPQQHTALSLTAVALVCKGNAAATALPHVASLIDAFAGIISPKWTLETASDRGLLRLLDRLLAQEWAGVSKFFRDNRFKHAVERAASSASLDVLNWWMTKYLPDHEDDWVVDAALRPDAMRAEVLQWLFEQGKLPKRHREWRVKRICYLPEVVYWISEHVMNARMIIGVDSLSDFEFIQWAHEQPQQRRKYELVGMERVLDRLSRAGNMEMLLWIHRNRRERCSNEALGYAISRGHADMAKWLHVNYPKKHFNDPWEAPCDLELIKWVSSDYKWKQKERQAAWIDNSIHNAIKANPDKSSLEATLSTLAFLYSIRQNNVHEELLKKQEKASSDDKQCTASRYILRKVTEAMDLAAMVGNLPVLQWLHLNRKNDGCTTAAMDGAAAMNHLDVVVWLHENRSEGCTKEAMNRAIANGHLNVVQWLHENRLEGCRLNVMDSAAGRGHFDTLKWLHENRSEGCTVQAIDHAVRGEYFETVKWLCENRSEGWSGRAIEYAADIGRLDIIEYLHDRRVVECSISAIDNAARGGHIHVMKWLVDHGMVAREHLFSVLVSSAQDGHVASVKFLTSYCAVYYDDLIVRGIARTSQFAVVEWLLKYSCVDMNIAIPCSFDN